MKESEFFTARYEQDRVSIQPKEGVKWSVQDLAMFLDTILDELPTLQQLLFDFSLNATLPVSESSARSLILQRTRIDHSHARKITSVEILGVQSSDWDYLSRVLFLLPQISRGSTMNFKP